MDNKIANIKERALQIPKNKGITNEVFSEKIGMTYGSFKGSARNRPLNSTAIENILTIYPDINPEWLLMGVGEMLRDTTPIAKEITQPTNEGIPLITIASMAGYGTGEQQVLDYECERYVVPVFKGADFLIPVKGSSMYPKYSSGDIVACKKLVVADIFFQWNKVYVLDTAQGALIKRVKKGSDSDHFLIVSENPQYEAFELHRSQIYTVAIVLGVIRLE